MSTIGPGSIGPFNLAGSFSGSQRADAADDRQKAEAADRKAKADRDQRSADVIEDVSDPELSADRDADGRLPYGGDANAAGPQNEEQDDAHYDVSPRHSHDAEGVRGRSLDLDV
jgi:hypothetical protein